MVLGRRQFIVGTGSLAFGSSCSFASKKVHPHMIPQLTAIMQVSSSKLEMNYVVTNSTEHEIFIFNIIHDEMHNGVFPVKEAYIDVNKSIIISKKLFPLPLGKFVERMNIPFSTRVMPGDDLREAFSLELPLAPKSPYLTVSRFPREVIQLDVLFEVGYFFAKPGSNELVKAFPTDRGTKYGFDVFDEGRQMVLRSNYLGRAPALVNR